MAISKIKSESIDLTDTGYTFGDLLVSGDLTIDTTSLTVDSTNNRVGIGTTTPDSPLHVQRGASSYSWTPFDGTTAILEGTYSGHSILSIVGTTRSEIWMGDASSQNSGRIRYEHESGGDQLEFWVGGSEKVHIESSGDVGIGTSSPTGKLTVIEDVSRSALTGTGVGQIHISGGATPADNDVSSITFSTNNTTTASSIIGNQITNNGSNLFFGTSNNYGSGVTNTAMFIDYAGNVGIGTSSPLYQFDVGNGSGNKSINIFSGSSNIGALYFTDSTSGTGSYIGRVAYDHSSDAMLFTTNTAERMRINSAGYVGIGTTSPETLLHLAGGSTATSGGAYAGITMTNRFDSPDNSWTIEPQRSGVSNTGLSIRDRTDNRIDMAFDGTGKVGIGTASPSST